MHPDLPVIYNTARAFMYEFYGVFNSDYMVLTHLIGIIYYCCQSGRLTTSGRSCDQDQSFMQHGKFFGNLRKTKLFNTQNSARDFPEYGCHAVFLTKEVGAVSGKPRDFIAEIHITGFLK